MPATVIVVFPENQLRSKSTLCFSSVPTSNENFIRASPNLRITTTVMRLRMQSGQHVNGGFIDVSIGVHRRYYAMDISMTSTTFDIPGYTIIRSLGVVRGITVRSRSLVGNIAGGIQSLFGGNITIYTELCERARQDAFDEMLNHARHIGVRYDANEIMQGITEVLAYGTAVTLEPVRH